MRYATHADGLLRGLTGTVLEIGAGTGANFGAFAASVRWIGLEPNRRRRRVLTETAARYGRHEPVLAAAAEDIPLPADSVDGAVSTIALCSVHDQDRCLAEVARVLRPGGRFVFAEHVAAPDGGLLYCGQRLIAPLSRLLDHGCDPARRTWQALERAPFSRLDVRWYAGSGRLATPIIAGYAVL